MFLVFFQNHAYRHRAFLAHSARRCRPQHALHTRDVWGRDCQSWPWDQRRSVLPLCAHRARATTHREGARTLARVAPAQKCILVQTRCPAAAARRGDDSGWRSTSRCPPSLAPPHGGAIGAPRAPLPDPMGASHAPGPGRPRRSGGVELAEHETSAPSCVVTEPHSPPLEAAAARRRGRTAPRARNSTWTDPASPSARQPRRGVTRTHINLQPSAKRETAARTSKCKHASWPMTRPTPALATTRMSQLASASLRCEMPRRRINVENGGGEGSPTRASGNVNGL